MARWPLVNIAICVTALSITVSCAPQGVRKLVDTLGSPIDETGIQFEPDFRALAPIIAVASVRQNRKIEERQAVRFPAVSLELHAVDCHLENLLKGRVEKEEFTFYYFTQSPNSPQPNPIYRRLFEAKPNERYLFFLTLENGILRAIGDARTAGRKYWRNSSPSWRRLAMPFAALPARR